MRWQFNDGGRANAGFNKPSGDCVARAIAIANNMDYLEVCEKIREFSANERTGKRKKKCSDPHKGVYKATYKKLLIHLGWNWNPTMKIGSGCKVHLRENELPNGTLIVSVSRHLTVVMDGVIHDTHNPDRRGTRCVYGYWTKNN